MIGLWKPYTPENKALRSMVRRLDELSGIKQQEQIRLKSGVCDAVAIESLQFHLKYLEEQIKALKQKIKEYVKQHPELRELLHLVHDVLKSGKPFCKTIDIQDGIYDSFFPPKNKKIPTGANPPPTWMRFVGGKRSHTLPATSKS